ncbi:hypothetical protein [Paenibacillus sophorae]|uniref:Uncharacterized protein n=1 Tax=Paenibacillus sophorae TaxID=1333845 RepID=A0ABX8H5F5_9BACL|nr:hypothetical protein [Paenibacillus sophorae]QWU13344.1 hypothetical protein KP014_15160 [Paenibacillus sophorae]
MEGIGALPELKTEPFRVLSKGLEYSLSVFAAAEPDAGLRCWSASPASPVPGLSES